MTISSALFDVEQYNTTPKVHDPYWDEIVLDSDCSGRDDNGQLTLFYDDSQEPPEPDDCDSLAEFEQAWSDWSANFPMPEQCSVLEEQPQQWQKEYRGYKCSFYQLPHGQIQFTVHNDYLICGTFQGEYENQSDAEIDFIDFIDKTYPQDRVPPPNREEMMRRALGGVINCNLDSRTVPNLQNLDSRTVPNLQKQTLPEQDLQPHSSTLPEQPKQWIEEYYVTRGGTKHWYYRYCYYVRGIHHIHIPGGNYQNAIAISRKEMIESAIAQGKSPSEIKNFIRGGFGMNGYKL